MDKVQTKRGGDADGPRSRPKDEHEDKQESCSATSSTTAFRPPIRLPARSRPARNRRRQSPNTAVDERDGHAGFILGLRPPTSS